MILILFGENELFIGYFNMKFPVLPQIFSQLFGKDVVQFNKHLFISYICKCSCVNFYARTYFYLW